MQTTTAHQTARRLLGLSTYSLDHPMWEDVQTLNDLRYVTLWLDNDVIWCGILNIRQAAGALSRLCRLYSNLEVSQDAVEHGVHYR